MDSQSVPPIRSIVSDVKQPKTKYLWGIFDARDSSLVPLQIVLLVLASIEAVQGVWNILFTDTSNNTHVYAHLGSYSLAYAGALFVISCRPARARGLLVLVSLAAIGFIATSCVDLIRGRAEIAAEMGHITKLIAPFIVWVIATRVIHYSRNNE